MGDPDTKYKPYTKIDNVDIIDSTLEKVKIQNMGKDRILYLTSDESLFMDRIKPNLEIPYSDIKDINFEVKEADESRGFLLIRVDKPKYEDDKKGLYIRLSGKIENVKALCFKLKPYISED